MGHGWSASTKEGPADPERLLALRQQKSRPVIERLQKWAYEVQLQARRPSQLEDLPPLLPGARVLLRDAYSAFDVTTGARSLASARQFEWRRHLAKRYGEECSVEEALVPDV